jgi:hypothetical protein
MAEDPRVEKIISESKKKARQKVERRRRARNNQKGEKFDWKDADVPADIDKKLGVKSISNRVLAQRIEDGEQGIEYRQENDEEKQSFQRNYDESNRYSADAESSETGQYTNRKVSKLKRHKETLYTGGFSPKRYRELQEEIAKLSGDPSSPLQIVLPKSAVSTAGVMSARKNSAERAEAERNYYEELRKEQETNKKVPIDDTEVPDYDKNLDYDPQGRATYSAVDRATAQRTVARLKRDIEAGKFGPTLPEEVAKLYTDLLRTAYPDYAGLYEQNEVANLIGGERRDRRQLARDQMIQEVRAAAASSTNQTSSEIVETGYRDTPEGRAELATRLKEFASPGVKARMVSNQNGELGIELIRSTQTPGERFTEESARRLLTALQPGAAIQRTNERVDLERRARNVEVNQDNQLVNFLLQLRGKKPVTPGAAQRYLKNMGDLTSLSKATEADYSLTNTPSERRALRTEIVDPNVVFVEDEGNFREATAPFNLVQPIEIQQDPQTAPQSDLRQFILQNYSFADPRNLEEGKIFDYNFDSAETDIGRQIERLGKEGAANLRKEAKKILKENKPKWQEFVARMGGASNVEQIEKTGTRNIKEINDLIEGAKYLINLGGGVRKPGGLMRGTNMEVEKGNNTADIDTALNLLGFVGNDPTERKALMTAAYQQEMGLLSSVNQEQKIAYVTRDNTLPRTMALSQRPDLIRGAKTGREPTTLQQLGVVGTFNKDKANEVAKLRKVLGSDPRIKRLFNIVDPKRIAAWKGTQRFDAAGNVNLSDPYVRSIEKAGAEKAKKEEFLTSRLGGSPETEVDPLSSKRLTGIVAPDMRQVAQLSKRLRRAETRLRKAEETRPMRTADREPVITSELLNAQREYEAIRQELDAALPAHQQAEFDRNQYIAASQQQSVDAGYLPADQLTTYVMGNDQRAMTRAYNKNKQITPGELKEIIQNPKGTREVPLMDNIIRLYGRTIAAKLQRDRKEQNLATEQVRLDRPKIGGTSIEQLNQLIDALQSGVKRAAIQTSGRASQTTVPLDVVDGALTFRPAGAAVQEAAANTAITEAAADPVQQARIKKHRLQDIEAVSDVINTEIEVAMQEKPQDTLPKNIMDIYNRSANQNITSNDVDEFSDWMRKEIPNDPVALSEILDVMGRFPRTTTQAAQSTPPAVKSAPAPKASGPDVVNQIINKYRREYEAGGPVNRKGELAAEGSEAARQSREQRVVMENRRTLAERILGGRRVLDEIRRTAEPAASPSGALVSLRPSAKAAPEQASRYYDGNNQYDVASGFSIAQLARKAGERNAAAPSPTTSQQTSGIPKRPSRNFTPPKRKVEKKTVLPDPGPSKNYTAPIRKAGTAVQEKKVDPIKKFQMEQASKPSTNNRRQQLLYALGALTGGLGLGAGAVALADREEEEQLQSTRY